MRFLFYFLFCLCYGISVSAVNAAAVYGDNDIAHQNNTNVATATVSASHTTTAHTKNNTAQSFAACPEHFWQGQAAVIQTSDEVFELCFYGFAILYSGAAKTALYAAHHLTADEVYQARQLSRIDSFRPENRLPRKYQAHLHDYRGSGYDRGHLVPNGDMFDVHSQYDSFSLANITPQDREHNRGVWQQIERHTRSLAVRYGDVYVLTGTVFYNQDRKAGDVLVPTHLYKAVYIPSIQMAAVYYSPNSFANEYEIISIGELKARTGVVPFVGVGDNFERSVFVLEGDGVANEQTTVNWWSWLALVLKRLWQQLA